MFSYQKTLQYPVRIKNTNPKLAAQIITQYGGPDGELGASLRYLSQRYAMPYPEIQGLLTDIGCEELKHASYIRKSLDFQWIQEKTRPASYETNRVFLYLLRRSIHFRQPGYAGQHGYDAGQDGSRNHHRPVDIAQGGSCTDTADSCLRYGFGRADSCGPPPRSICQVHGFSLPSYKKSFRSILVR